MKFIAYGLVRPQKRASTNKCGFVQKKFKSEWLNVVGQHTIGRDGRNQVSKVIAAGTYLSWLIVHDSNGEVVSSKTPKMTMVNKSVKLKI